MSLTMKTVATGSSGNCHVLNVDGEWLILDAGITKHKMMYQINFEMDFLAGVIVTHRHVDHYMAVPKLKQMGINLFCPFDEKEPKERYRRQFGKFIIDAFALTDTKGEQWVHTNLDGSPCENYAYVIRHLDYLDTWNLLYATDCQYIKWVFPDIHNVLLGVDYDNSLLDTDNQKKTEHQVFGHLSIDTAIRFVKKNNPDQNIILTHLSETSADPDLFKYRMKNETGTNAEITIARPKYHVRFID